MSKFKKFMVKPWIFVLVLVIGIFFVFYHIDYRYFWLDEISTVEQTSGLNREGIDRLAPVNEIANLAYYKSLVRLNDHNLPLVQQLKGQIHTMNLNPLHYFLLAFWHSIFSDSPLALRLFSTLMFLLTAPFIFLLAKKLFGTNLSGWIALSLYSVFNYFHYYSHEARYVMLTVFLIVTTSYFLLEAIERKKIGWWVGYIITGMLALYASAILGLMFIGHIFFMIMSRKKIFPQFFASICIIFLLYLPWLLFIAFSFKEVEEAFSWQLPINDNYNFLFLIILQILALSNGFIALEDPYSWFLDKSMQSFSSLIYILMAIFIFASIFYSAKKMERGPFYFLLSMFLSSFLFFLISDLIRNAGSSLLVRYHYISVVAALFFMAFFLANKISKQKVLYLTLYAIIAALGIFSIYQTSQSKNWYIHPAYDFTPIHYIENAEECLLVTDFESPNNNGITAFLMVANEIQYGDIDILRTTSDNPAIEELIYEKSYSDIYVIYASEQLLENLSEQFGDRLTQIDDPDLYNPFWRIKL